MILEFSDFEFLIGKFVFHANSDFFATLDRKFSASGIGMREASAESALSSKMILRDNSIKVHIQRYSRH